MTLRPLTPVPAKAQPAVLELHRRARDSDEPGLYAQAIEAAVAVTGSEIGYFHLVNADQETIELGTWSAGTLRVCTASYDRHYPLSSAGVWADSARNRRPQVHNDYQALTDKKGYPDGHAHLVRHLGVPVVEEDRVVLLVGVGNKATDYDEEDLACLQAIADAAWSLIESYRQKVALERSQRQLEDIQDLATICVWEWDPDEQTLHCDGNAKRIFAADPLGGMACSVEGLLRFIDTRDHGILLDALRQKARDTAFDMELRAFRADGAPLTVHFRGAAFPRSQGHGVVVRGILQDITERREMVRIKYHANHDALTGLTNRTALMAQLDARLHNSRRSPKDAFAVHFIDLDRFKPVNDSFGHAVGDQVLRIVAERLLLSTRKEDLVARLGGDELVVVQDHVPSLAAAEALAEKIIAALEAPMKVDGHDIQISASIGIAMPRPSDEKAEWLLSRADMAMYQAKAGGRGHYRVG